MKVKRKIQLKKTFKICLIIISLVLVIKIFYPILNSIELPNVGITIEDNSLNDPIYNPSKYDDVSSSSNNNGTIFERLEELVKQDSRINNIINNYNKYPEELLDMLSRNIDMYDFVINYPEKKGNVYSDNVGKIQKGTIPLLLQWDERWGYADYGNSSIAISGCGPTALSMVITGLTGDNSITPYVVAKFSEKNGYYSEDSGTSWYLMTEGARKLGVNSKEISLSKNVIFQALENGHPIICSMRKGDFTTTGHFIVLVGIKDGKIKVNDPNSKEKSNLLWDYERLEYQIKNLWELSS